MHTSRLEFSVYPPSYTCPDAHHVGAIEARIYDHETGEPCCDAVSAAVNPSRRYDPVHFAVDIEIPAGKKARRVRILCVCVGPDDPNMVESVPVETVLDAGAERPGIAELRHTEDRRMFLPKPGRVQINSGKAEKKSPLPYLQIEHVVATVPGASGKAAEMVEKIVAAFPEDGFDLVIPSGDVCGSIVSMKSRKNGADLEMVAMLNITIPSGHRADQFPGVEGVSIDTTRAGKMKRAVLTVVSPAAAASRRMASQIS